MKKYRILIGIFVVSTLVFGTIYASLQYVVRSVANDPQVQLAKEVATNLNTGSKPDTLVGAKVTLGNSLSPAYIIYDRQGQAVSGTALLAEALPVIPFGVLQHADTKTYHAVTWQPGSNVRLASVTVAANEYYVTAVRSLRLTEEREQTLLTIVLGGWLIATAGSAAIFFVHQFDQEAHRKSVKKKK